MALVLERERRVERRLERARALMAGELDRARQGIPLAVKRAVWVRCGGRCAECGVDRLLEFDHVIPLAMGGSDGERNLQLLCADCNRGKGASL
jgi:5-methylcytosine-specific restriction endonuclease McrA